MDHFQKSKWGSPWSTIPEDRSLHGGHGIHPGKAACFPSLGGAGISSSQLSCLFAPYRIQPEGRALEWSPKEITAISQTKKLRPREKELAQGHSIIRDKRDWHLGSWSQIQCSPSPSTVLSPLISILWGRQYSVLYRVLPSYTSSS